MTNVGSVTVKELDLSAAELAALTQVSTPSDNNNQAQVGQAAQAQNIFTNESVQPTQQLIEQDPDAVQENEPAGEVEGTTNQ